jgi:hypothetical protein
MPVTANSVASAASPPANSPAPQAAQQTSGNPVSIVPFARAAKPHIEQGVVQNIASASWTGGNNQQFLVPSYGYLRGLILTATASGGVNGTKTVAAYEDAPWNLFSNVLFTDSNGAPIINCDGYALHLVRLLGGYRGFRDDKSTFGFSAISTGASGTGNFKAKFDLFNEFARDGLGDLPNMDASAAYRLNLTYNSPTAFYGTALGTPGTPPSLAALLEIDARTRPASVDGRGKPQATQPPASGTIQYVTSQTFQVNSGQNTHLFTRTGNTIRGHILVWRSATDGTRATAVTDGTMPTVLEFDYDAGIRYKVNIDTLQQRSYEAYGFDLDNGVIELMNTKDPDGSGLAEYGDEWLPTTGATKLQLQYTSTHAGTLQVITIDFVPGSGSPYDAPAMQLLGG